MSSNVAYQRLISSGDADKTPKARFHIKFTHFTLATCSLPLLAFSFCIGYSLIFNFDRSIATSCGAVNILPSISAAIGGFSPQREVWQAAITIDFLPRLVLIYVYLKYSYDGRENKVIYIRSLLMTIENFALLSLTYFDSTHDYTIHRNSFTLFIITSQLHMLLLSCVQRRSGRYETRLKKRIAFINSMGIIFAMISFVVHELWCPDYAYSIFAFCEYVFVLTNIAYHSSIMFDFDNMYLSISLADCIKLEEFSYSHIVMQL